MGFGIGVGREGALWMAERALGRSGLDILDEKSWVKRSEVSIGGISQSQAVIHRIPQRRKLGKATLKSPREHFWGV